MSRYCHSPGIGIAAAWCKTLIFSNISVITEDIYLKLRVFVHYQKGTHISRGGNPPIFFDKVTPLFRQNFLNAAAAECWHPHAVLLFRHSV